MKAIILVLGLIAIASAVEVGVAQIRGTSNDPTIFGYVTFTTSGTSVLMSVNVTGITNNLGVQHGIHIHQFGDISVASGAAPGSHWNIYNQNHGCPPSTVRHIGDTGNWDVSAGGSIVATKTLDLITLTGLNSLIGFGVIVHNRTDDCNDTLSSQARLGQGVIGVANPAYYGATANTAFPTSTYTVTSAICNFQLAAGGANTGSAATGWVKFDQANANATTYVTAAIAGLVGGNTHGFHVHQYGDLSLQDATSAGPHYTGPTYDANSPHSIPGSTFAHHVGDMGNLYYYDISSGIAYFSFSTTSFGLYGHPNSVIGRAVILHDAPDNCDQPYGNAGARAYVCVIGPANPAYGGANTIPLGVPTTQNSTLCHAFTTGITTSTTGEMESSFASLLIPSFILAFILSMF